MYYEDIITEVDNLKKFIDSHLEIDRLNTHSSQALILRKKAEACGTTGRNLADVFQIYNFMDLIAAIREREEENDYSMFEIGDYLIVPTMVFNGGTYNNWQFDLVGINSYKGIGAETDDNMGLVFVSRKTCFNSTWPGENAAYYVNLGTDLEARMGGITLRNSNHFYGQQRQAVWTKNKVFLLGEQEVGNPQNTFTIGNGHSCQFLPLFKRSPIYRIKDSTPGTRNTWWLASRDSITNDVTSDKTNLMLTINGRGNFHAFYQDANKNTANIGVVPSFYL